MREMSRCLVPLNSQQQQHVMMSKYIFSASGVVRLRGRGDRRRERNETGRKKGNGRGR